MLTQFGPGVGSPDRDVLLLYLAEQPLDPSRKLPLQLRPVDDHHDGRVAEPVSLFSRTSRAAVSSVNVLPEPCVCQTSPRRFFEGSAQRSTMRSTARR